MLHLTINGQDYILADDIDPGTPLLWVLRDHLGLVCPPSAPMRQN